ncbi:glycine/D-amino acid oxidase-like deaminating enzyme [Palleronia aestuarii]|uniref:Glycine/D-amino acid oxidase-like deaminating enzyme n=1 Tax=Palleronia aestuarii TaxID=568105 RepID=A0A2W7N845_9RHOB|nr:FAD-binding oxidoreductase [Palleronia aestuarii]PZX16321.1 glycine/D-amino acid oxidase-like deaminating enzyme [Palleronia aestuarii]
MARRPAPRILWRETAPEDASYPPLEGTLDVDVAVIGGGFTGISTAYHLAASGVTVAVLEAETIGFGGSGRNVGLVNAGLWMPPDAVEAELGAEEGAALNARLADGPTLVFELIERLQIECEAVRQGTLHLAHSPSGLRDLEDRHAQQRTRGSPVRLLDAEETARRTGSTAFHGALWDARAGTIQPLAYVQGLARAAAAQGARICEHSVVESTVRDGGAWRLVTRNGIVRAPRLVRATNAYGTGGGGPNPIIAAHYFQLATAPLAPAERERILAGGEGCWDTATIMSSFRMDRAGRLILGALGDLGGAGGSAHRGWAKRKLRHLFPRLRDLDFEHAWTGRVAMTSAHLPRVERLGEGAVSIFGYSGRGIAPGTVFGQAAANWATGQGTFPVVITDPVREPRAALRSAAYESGATLFHLIDSRRSAPIGPDRGT